MMMGLDGWRIASFSLSGWVQRCHEIQIYGPVSCFIFSGVFARRMRHRIQAVVVSGGCFVAKDWGLAYKVVLRAARSFVCGTVAMWESST